MTNPNKEHFITDAPMFSDAPSGSDMGEGVRAARLQALYDAHREHLGLPFEPLPADGRGDLRGLYGLMLDRLAALCPTSSSTLTPDANRVRLADQLERYAASYDSHHRDIADDFRNAAAIVRHSATPAIRDQDAQINRDLRTQEYIEAANAEIKRLQVESDARADQAFEEAARVAEQVARLWGSVGSAANEAADRIRALKGTPPSRADATDYAYFCNDPACEYQGRRHPYPYCEAKLPRASSPDLLKELVEALEDCGSHRDAWRNGLILAWGRAEVRPPDMDDKAYWRHELAAFDRTFAALLKTQHPEDSK